MSLLRWGIEVGGVFVVEGGGVMGRLLLSLRPGEVPPRNPTRRSPWERTGESQSRWVTPTGRCLPPLGPTFLLHPKHVFILVLHKQLA